jgi:hypothetical protein
MVFLFFQDFCDAPCSLCGLATSERLNCSNHPVCFDCLNNTVTCYICDSLIPEEVLVFCVKCQWRAVHPSCFSDVEASSIHRRSAPLFECFDCHVRNGRNVVVSCCFEIATGLHFFLSFSAGSSCAAVVSQHVRAGRCVEASPSTGVYRVQASSRTAARGVCARRRDSGKTLAAQNERR